MYMVSYVFPWFSTYIIVYAPKIPRPTEHSSSVMIFTLWHILTNCWLYLSYNIFFTLLPNLTTMLSGKMIKKKFHQTPPSNAWNVLTAQDIPPFSVGTSCSVCCATDIKKKSQENLHEVNNSPKTHYYKPKYCFTILTSFCSLWPKHIKFFLSIYSLCNKSRILYMNIFK